MGNNLAVFIPSNAQIFSCLEALVATVIWGEDW
jgi:hypothetical protein